MAIKLRNYNTVKASGDGKIPTPPPGGYVCKIVRVSIEQPDAENKSPKLIVLIDIAEGEYAGCFRKIFDTYKDKWPSPAIFRPSIFDANGDTHPFMKSFLEAVKKSNPGYEFGDAFDEQTLVGKLCGFIFGDKEWVYDGNEGIHTVARFPRSVEKIRSGDFKIPDLQKHYSNQTEPKAKIFSAPQPTQHNDFGGEPLDLDDPPF